MTAQLKPWTRREYLTYLLFYAAMADNEFKTEEKEHIMSKVGRQVYDKVLLEFNMDNNYQAIQKIIAYNWQEAYFTTEEIINEFMDLFLSDDQFHHLEQYTLFQVRRLLK